MQIDEERPIPWILDIGRDRGGEPPLREAIRRLLDAIRIDEGARQQTSTDEGRAARLLLDHARGDAAPELPGADIGVDVKEEMQILGQLPHEPRAQRVVMRALIGAMRHLDQQRGERARIGRDAIQALDLDNARDRPKLGFQHAAESAIARSMAPAECRSARPASPGRGADAKSRAHPPLAWDAEGRRGAPGIICRTSAREWRLSRGGCPRPGNGRDTRRPAPAPRGRALRRHRRYGYSGNRLARTADDSRSCRAARRCRAADHP